MSASGGDAPPTSTRFGSVCIVRDVFSQIIHQAQPDRGTPAATVISQLQKIPEDLDIEVRSGQHTVCIRSSGDEGHPPAIDMDMET